ncbi:cytosolic sulfotransferase 2-like [Nelusetta ayraudi]|uniref:cytosolic sulfotransferase 2-like n=1 Tax=Nelusetta ayraudi TaxID=303726 RepID=UPI003F70F70B
MSADTKKDGLTREVLFDFHGVPMTTNFTDKWDKIQNFQAKPDDILIATYPKAGTTWVSYMLDLLYFGQEPSERETSVAIYDRVPFLERKGLSPGLIAPSLILYVGVDLANNLKTTPRIIKTHLPIQLLPKSFCEQNSKIVYVARNAKDNAVSYFHMDRMTLTQPDPGDWSCYIQRYMDGQVLYGSWYDHVNGWWKKKQTYPNLHYMFYEDMVEDTGRELDKLCSFLGLSPSAEQKKEILVGVQFDQMKKNNMVNYSKFVLMDFNVSTFMRKGKVGDWKTHFTVAQNEVFDEHYKTKMKDPTLQFRTEM